MTQLEQFLFEEACRLEQAAGLTGRAREISRVLSQCDPVANGIDLSLLEHVSPYRVG